MLNVLIVSQYYWPEQFRITDVAVSLVENGANVIVLTGHPNYPEGRIYAGYKAWRATVETRDGVTILRVPMVPRGNRSSLFMALNYLSFVISAALFGPWLLRKRKVDAIFVYAVSPILQALPAFVIGRLKSARVSIWVQDLWPEALSATGFVNRPALLGAVRRLVRWIYRTADALLIPSEAFRDAIESFAPVGHKIGYFPNSAETVFLETVEELDPLALKSTGKFNVVFAGNVGIAQSLETIVGAAKLLQPHSDIDLIIVGSGSRSDWLADEVSGNELSNIRLVGRLPVTCMPAIMGAADALLVTLAEQDIFARTIPSKIQAYLAAGRPIIAAISGEGARIVNLAKAGLAVPAEDVSALAEAILEIRNKSAADRYEMGQAGKRYSMEHFHHPKLMQSLFDHLSGLAGLKETH